MEKFVYTPSGVCSRKIELILDGDRIALVKFTGGCSGNTQGVASLLRDMTVDEAISRLYGIKCGFKNTSCPDQVAKALELYKNKKNNGEVFETVSTAEL
jgi:uncharacterized protein (TIGR03905 family)